MKNDSIAIPADPLDDEDFDTTREALDRGLKDRKMRHKGGVFLPESLLNSQGWARLRVGPRMLYVEMLRRASDGPIFISQSEAGASVNVGAGTARGYLYELVKHGLIREVDAKPTKVGLGNVHAYEVIEQ